MNNYIISQINYYRQLNVFIIEHLLTKTQGVDGDKLFYFITVLEHIFFKYVFMLIIIIMLISDYRGQLQFLIFFIFCVVSSHQ